MTDKKLHLKRLNKKYIERHGRKRGDWRDHLDEFLTIQKFNDQFCSSDLVVDNLNQNRSIKKIIDLIKQKAK